MNRRKFSRALLGGAAGLAAPRASAQAEDRPNIVILFADDLGYGDLGCYGHPTIRTPNLDRMASEGMRFTQFYSAAPVCTPSRAALMTGRLPIRTGLTHVLFPYSTGGIPDSEVTLAEILKSRGYATACVGKWHLGHRPQFLPVRHGFDSYFGIPYSNDMSPKTNPRYKGKQDAPPTPLIENDKIVEEEPDQSQITRRYTERAVEFLRKATGEGKPFFLYFPHTFPHIPLFASERFRGKSPRGLYGDVVEELDWSAGEVFRTLRELNQEKHTLVFFSSDNGPWLIQREAGGSAGLLREGKTSTWEGGVREPFLAWGPGRIAAGVVTQAFGTLMDLFPTCARLAGAEAPADREYDGQDLGPVFFQNDPGREPFHIYYYLEELHAIRKGRWKLHIVTTSPTAPDYGTKKHDPPLLFDLLADPSEKYSVADSDPGVVNELLGLIAEHKRTLKAGPPQR